MLSMHPPENATSRQESEMANKSLRALQSSGSSGDPVQRLRLLCLSRGANGILELGRLFRKLDKNDNQTLNLEQFELALREIGLDITFDEEKELFDNFDTDGSGTINIDEILIHVRPPLSQFRLSVIDKAFQKIDHAGYGEITIDNLKRVYNVKSDPRYISGEDSEEAILKTFVDHFERGATKDRTVTKEEFLNYYAAISASIDNDCYFDLMMRQVYKL